MLGNISNQGSSTLKAAVSAASSRFASYDVVVVGGGPGGYPAAIRASQQGLKVANIEKNKLGGTCLNVGCIPSKALLNASLKMYEAKAHFKGLGLKGGNKITVDMPTMLKNKNSTIKQLIGGITFLFKKNGVEQITGVAKFDESGKLFIEKPDGTIDRDVEAKNVVLALGSTPSWFPGMDVDGDRVITSDHALDLKKVPKKMIVIGGGVIGLELGTVFNRLGSSVEVVEFLPRICPSLDGAIAKSFQKVLTKQGLKFHLETKVLSAKTVGDKVQVVVQGKDGKEVTHEADYCLVAVGRKPNTASVGLEHLGVETDRVGRIPTEDFKVTKSKDTAYNLWAIGDCIQGPMLAHKAEEDGIALADAMSGKPLHVPDYNTCPQVVYTEPEVAGVGKSEEELKAAGVKYKKAIFQNTANSRSKVIGATDGEVKFLYCPDTLKVLGGWMMGVGAGELIHTINTIMHNDRTIKDLSSMTFAHPTLSEAVKEAAMLAVDGMCIHS